MLLWLKKYSYVFSLIIIIIAKQYDGLCGSIMHARENAWQFTRKIIEEIVCYYY